MKETIISRNGTVYYKVKNPIDHSWVPMGNIVGPDFLGKCQKRFCKTVGAYKDGPETFFAKVDGPE